VFVCTTFGRFVDTCHTDKVISMCVCVYVCMYTCVYVYVCV